MPAPEIIHQLVAKFTENREAYRSGRYNEARLRQEFLDPFFEALGWDVYNKAGLAPEYAEVAVEDSLEIEGSSKAPDYAFKVGRERKFYVEAKKPAVDIQYDIHPAFQLRRYAWNAHLPLSVLTDFEEFAIYNCKAKPDPKDSAATSRDLYYKYTDYVEKWDEIAGILSKDAVWKGGYDRYADTSKGKKGTTEVDDEFLKDMSEWRNLLAHNIALRNPQVADEAQLNYAVQMTIDRILFLRICEDRGIEPEEQLKGMAGKANIYAQLVELFKRADVKYNSGLFHFQKEKGNGNAVDSFTPGLKIDDKVLKELINSIYYPCPYIFKEIPVEILGQVYEQFLGKVIRLTAGHQAKVEEKPEVRKAGGVYYTPRYIVDYIVSNTVGKLLEGKTPEEAAKLKVVDPACGSGSFLLGAYQHLLDWHLKWYMEHEPERWVKGKNPALVQVTALPGGSARGYRLTTEKKKEILVNSVHGVDIDAQAVEVTKLSLLLKVLEEESGQLSLGFERVLPDLGKNIQCGNSLIGEDYFEGRLTVDPEERKRVNPFEWERAFPEVFAQGGFDAVIGNPPWGGNIDNDLIYFHKNFPNSTQDHTDSFKIFIEKGNNLLSHFGLLSFIVPNTLLRQRRYQDVRRILLSIKILTIVDFGENVFKGVVAPSCVFIVQNASYVGNLINFLDLSKNKNKEVELRDFEDNYYITPQLNFLECIGKVFLLPSVEMKEGIKPLGEISELDVRDAGINYQRKNVGMEAKGKSDLALRLLYEGQRESTLDFMYWKGTDINRYWIAESTNRFCRSDFHKFTKPNESVSLNKLVFSTKPKILLRQTADHIIATIDYKGVWFGRSIISILLDSNAKHRIEYYLGLLNSKYINTLYTNLSQEENRVFAQVKLNYIKQISIRQIDFAILEDVKMHDAIVALVQRMFNLHKRITATPQEEEHLVREIASTDREIDRLVYELYGLSEEEIRIVEGG